MCPTSYFIQSFNCRDGRSYTALQGNISNAAPFLHAHAVRVCLSPPVAGQQCPRQDKRAVSCHRNSHHTLPWPEIAFAPVILCLHQCCWRQCAAQKVHCIPGCIQWSVVSRTPLLWSGETPPGVLRSGNGFSLKGNRFRLCSRKKFLTGRVMSLWNQMPGEVVNAPSLEVFKVRFNGGLVQGNPWATWSSARYPFPRQEVWN